MALNPKKFVEEGFDLPKLEEKVLAFWEDNKIFEKSLEKTKDGKPFTFYDGPPFATGVPHYGHILASTIKDLIPRYQTMNGRFVRRRWGWDCHGLPVEEIVERKLKISGKKQIEEIGIKKFNETCRNTVLQYVSEWRKTVRRIARWVDFDHSYKTMDLDYMESVWWAFKQVYDKGLAYEGKKVLLYCPRCETPISNFEVAMDNSYQTVKEEAVTIKFKVKPGQRIGGFTSDDKTFILAWTTTPWTLPGNVALAIGEKIEYVLLHRNGETLIAAKDRLPALHLEGEAEVVPPQALLGLQYEPLFDIPDVKSEKSFRVYPADFVTTDEGTGIVHTAVVYGEEDYELGVRVGLPVVPLLDEKGKFNDKAPESLRGKYFKTAEPEIKADVESRGLLFKKEMHEHSYPHCWRCGTALFYNAIPAWFINIKDVKEKLLKSNEKEVNWFPEHLKHGRYAKSVEAAPDWNISRNRYWGNPIPIWKCEKCNTVEVVGSVDELLKKTEGPKNIYFVIRHGESESNISNVIDSGQSEFHLTEKGKAQVKKAAEELKKENIDVVIASPILRAKETAEIVASALGREVIFDDRLREIQLGTLSGCHDSKYHELFPTYESKFEGKPEGGESLRDLRARQWDLLRELEGKYEGKKILLVSHEYPIWMLTQSAEAWSENRAIAEMKKHDPDFIENAEWRKLDFKTISRNDTGEADLHRPYIDEITVACGKCKGKSSRISEIFDSWVEAGSMPFSEYHYPFENKETFEKRLPAQFVAEYIAQTRAWFYVMHVISVILFGKAPFENVVTTGTILAEDGSKMSKSKQNFPDPWQVIEKYGVDSLRFYLMNSVVMQADNLNFSVRDLENVYRRVLLILWNVYNYFDTYASEHGWDPKKKGEPTVLDKWIKAKTQELVNEVTERFDHYDTVRATRAIEAYVEDLSTWYIRRSRGRTDAAFFETLHSVLGTAARVIAPVMPYISEVLYANLNRFKESDAESVHLADWPSRRDLSSEEKELIREMEAIREAASVGMALRKSANIPVRQPLLRVAVELTTPGHFSPELIAILLQELNVKHSDPELAAQTGEHIKKLPGVKLVKEVYLDTALTDDLKLEGTIRGIERFVQEMRKVGGLKVGEPAELFYETADPMLQAAVKKMDTKKTYISKIEKAAMAESVTYETEGKKIAFALKRN